jgi:hypothetical protein
MTFWQITLAIYLILQALALLGLAIPAFVLGIAAGIAAVLLLVGR